MSIVSSQVDTTRVKLLKYNIVQESEVPILLPTTLNKLTKKSSYVECHQAYECSVEDFAERLSDGRIWDTGGVLSEKEMLAVLQGVLISDQVPEEIKERLR